MLSEKIMIVDDNKELLEELKEILDISGYESVVVSDPKVAFGLARKLRPNLILLDLKMANMNGFEVARKLKTSAQTKSIPIIAMSGYFPIENQANLLDMSDMKAYLKKPFAILDLISQIEAALSGKAQGLSGYEM